MLNFKQAFYIAFAILFFFLTLFLYSLFAPAIPFSVNSIVTQKTDTFQATGVGTASVKPDIAVVNVGVQANALTVKGVQEQINSKINQVTSAIVQLGIAKEDIKTSNYSVNPTYDFRENTQRITGYNANTNLIIKVKDVDKVNQVIDSATQNGANQIGGITFDVDDKSTAENQAREQAVAEAKKKAEHASKVGGFRIGKLINYYESFMPEEVGLYSNRAELSVDSRGGAPTEPTQIQPGSNEVQVTVTLSYEIL